MRIVNSALLSAAILVSAVSATGCYKHTFTVGSGGNVEAEPTYEVWHSHWLWGIIGDENVDVNKVCPSGNATIKEKTSFVNGLIGGLVGTIYYPTTVEIYCGEGPAAPKAASITLSPERLREIALDPAALAAAREVSETKAAELQAAIETFRANRKNVASSAGSARF